jgi:hypothetical protein
MSTTDQATYLSEWTDSVTILTCLVDVDFLFALYPNIDFHLGTDSPLLRPTAFINEVNACMLMAEISPRILSGGHTCKATLFGSLTGFSLAASW